MRVSGEKGSCGVCECAAGDSCKPFLSSWQPRADQRSRSCPACSPAASLTLLRRARPPCVRWSSCMPGWAQTSPQQTPTPPPPASPMETTGGPPALIAPISPLSAALDTDSAVCCFASSSLPTCLHTCTIHRLAAHPPCPSSACGSQRTADLHVGPTAAWTTWCSTRGSRLRYWRYWTGS